MLTRTLFRRRRDAASVTALIAALPDGRTLTVAVPRDDDPSAPVLRIGAGPGAPLVPLTAGAGRPSRWEAVVDLARTEGDLDPEPALQLERRDGRAGIHPGPEWTPPPPPGPVLGASTVWGLQRGLGGGLVLRRGTARAEGYVVRIRHAPGFLKVAFRIRPESGRPVGRVVFRVARTEVEVAATPQRSEDLWWVRVPIASLAACQEPGVRLGWTARVDVGGTWLPLGRASEDVDPRLRLKFPVLPAFDEDRRVIEVRPGFLRNQVLQVNIRALER